MFVVPIRTTLRLKLILKLVDVREKMRPDTIQVCRPEFLSPTTMVLSVMFRLADVIYPSCANIFSQAFQLVSDRGTMLTVHRESGLPILAKYTHDTTICAQVGVSSPIQ